MRRLGLWVALVSSVLTVMGCAKSSGDLGTERSSATSGSIARLATPKDCPNPLKLPGNGVAPAANRALEEAGRLYDGLNTKNTRVTQAARGPAAGVRGRQIRKECGGKVQRRSVVVELFFPEMRESASLSQGTVFVSRFPRGYRVWERAH